MAIYKPTFCSPLEGSFDLTATGDLPVYIECQIDTSNTVINGYSIELYNEEGTRIFPDIVQTYRPSIPDIPNDKIITSIFQLNDNGYSCSGVNGTKLRFPFIVSSIVHANIGDYHIENNQMINNHSSLIVNKRYFWKLTLYQITESNSTDLSSSTPSDDKFYDMNLTTGTVLGSTNKRIQTLKSDKIGLDYYVQPVYIPSLSAGTGVGYNPTSWTHMSGGQQTQIANVGPRALIKSYDSTHGHIYPVVGENGIDDAVIKYDSTSIDSSKANGVRIYKMSNNANDLNAYQKVGAAPEVVIPWERWVTSTENPGDSYGIQEYYMTESDLKNDIQNSTQYYYPFDVQKTNNTPIELADDGYDMLAVTGANNTARAGWGNYMLSIAKDQSCLYAIYPHATGDKVFPILSRVNNETVQWLSNPVYWRYSNSKSYWCGTFKFTSGDDTTHEYLIQFSLPGKPEEVTGAPTATMIHIQQTNYTNAGVSIVNGQVVCMGGGNYRWQKTGLSFWDTNGNFVTPPYSFNCLGHNYTITNYYGNVCYGRLATETVSSYLNGFYITTVIGNDTFLLEVDASSGSIPASSPTWMAHNITNSYSNFRPFYIDVYDHAVFIRGIFDKSYIHTYRVYEYSSVIDEFRGMWTTIAWPVGYDVASVVSYPSTTMNTITLTRGQTDTIWVISQSSYELLYVGDSDHTVTSIGYLAHGDYYYFSLYEKSTKVTTIFYFRPNASTYVENMIDIGTDTLNVDEIYYTSLAEEYYNPSGGPDKKYYMCLVINNKLYYIRVGVGSSPIYNWYGGSRRTLGIASGSQPRIILDGQIQGPTNSEYVKSQLNLNEYPTFDNVIGAGALPTARASAYNGIYYPTFSTQTMYNTVVKVSVRWTRVPDANTWGEISTKIVLVDPTGTGKLALNGYTDAWNGKNVQINRTDGTSTAGVINSTPFHFMEEKPIDLYEYDATATGNNDINNTGLIFYNHVDGNVGTLYVRPFIGIHGGQKYIDKKTSTNTFDIIHVDDYSSGHYGTWFVNYNVGGQTWTSNLKPDEDKYKINTYFTTSDEYNFRLEEKPSLINHTVTNTPKLHPMQYDFTVTYKFAEHNYVSWNSFQWQLYSDANYTQPIDIQEVKHNMGIECSFYGLIPGTTYYPKCVVTTNSGRILESTVSGGHAPGSQGTESTTEEWYDNDPRTDIKYEILCDDGAVRIYLPTHTNYKDKTCHILKREVWQEPNSQVWSGEPVYKPVKLNINAPSGGRTNNEYVDDYNVGNHRIYEYVVYLSDGTNTSTYKTIRIEPCWMGCVIMSLKPDTKSELGTYTSINGDSNNIWHFRYNLEQGSETLNMAHNVQTTLSQYPSFSYGPTQYLTGNFSCLIGDGFKVGETVHDPIGARANTGYYENLAPRNHTMSNWAVNRLSEWRKFCASSTPKLLKDDKGQIMLVQISSASNQVNLHWNKMPETINFDWTEIGDATKLISHD